MSGKGAGGGGGGGGALKHIKGLVAKPRTVTRVVDLTLAATGGCFAVGTATIKFYGDGTCELEVNNAEHQQGRFDYKGIYSAAVGERIAKAKTKLWEIFGVDLKDIKVMKPSNTEGIAAVWSGDTPDAVSRRRSLMFSLAAVAAILGKVVGPAPQSPNEPGGKPWKAKLEFMALFNIFLPAKYRVFSYPALASASMTIMGMNDKGSPAGKGGYPLPVDF
jgi:hypothetical protein